MENRLTFHSAVDLKFINVLVYFGNECVQTPNVELDNVSLL